MNCLLVSTLLDDLRSLGLLSIYSYVKNSQRHNVKLVFLPNHGEYEKLETAHLMSFIRENNVGVVAFSLMTRNYHKCVEVTRRIHEELKDVRVVWGGIHPTTAPDECIEHADYVCIGEGEVPLLELLDHMESGKSTLDLDSFWIRDNGKIIRNGTRFFPNITDYPRIIYDWDNFFLFEDQTVKPFDLGLYRKYSMWNGTNYSTIASRGCPYSCTYCCNSVLKEKMYGKNIRRRNVDDIIGELRDVKKYLPHTEVINFQDDCFIASSKSWLVDFCDEYRREIGLPFFCRATPTAVNEERISTLADAGLTGISIGLQTGDDWINSEVYKRRMTGEDFLGAAEMVKKLGLWAVYDIILEGPYDTDASYYETARLLLQTRKPFVLNIFQMTLFPNTDLYERCRKENIAVDGDPYRSGYGNTRNHFYRFFFPLLPIMPASLMKSFLEKRDRPWAMPLVRFLFNRLSFIRLLRQRLAAGGFNNRIVRVLFRIQARLFS